MFQPAVPVFDGHAALGRRHDARVAVDTPEGLLQTMEKAGIGRALVYHPYAAAYDTVLGNRQMLEMVKGRPALTPQFIVNMASDALPDFKRAVDAAGVRSVRVCPKRHLYPFTRWVADEWLAWLTDAGIGLWVSMDDVDVRDLYETVQAHPGLRVVLSGVHYNHFAAVWPLVRALPRTFVELSRLDIMDGVKLFHARVGAERLVFGSHFPELDPAPYLFYLHRCGLDASSLQAICHDNLANLLASGR